MVRGESTRGLLKKPMAKKKKSQLKPVARGFATTSVPKKPAVTDQQSIPQIAHIPHVAITTLNGDSSGENIVTESSVPVTNTQPVNGLEYDAEKAEEQFLQNLVDKYQEKTGKEITRTLRVKYWR